MLFALDVSNGEPFWHAVDRIGVPPAEGDSGDELGRLRDQYLLRQLASADSALTNALSRLNVVMEAYPDLKASENMKQLSEELTSTENRVAFSRQAYNDQVMAYNTMRQSFPTVLLAPFFGHNRDAALLSFEDRAAIQAAPKVSF